MPEFSVIIPVKNEEGNILELLRELAPVMEGLEKPWEVIVVDDGSTDKTLSILRACKCEFPTLRVLVFRENVGQSGAFAAGFKAARGEWVITLDGDRQNDPKDIPLLLSLAQKGYDLVCGRRVNRKDSLSKKLISRFSNALRKMALHDGVNDTGCSLKIMRRSCLNEIKMFQGTHRFLPALFALEGFRVRELAVHHRERLRGKSHYNIFNRSIKPLVDLFALLWMRKRHLHFSIKEEF